MYPRKKLDCTVLTPPMTLHALCCRCMLIAAKYELEEEAHLTGGTYIPLLTATDDRPEGGSVSADKYVIQSSIHYTPNQSNAVSSAQMQSGAQLSQLLQSCSC
jgi:hypothetical protein